jgi:plastocyanin
MNNPRTFAMRFSKLVVLASAVSFTACGGEKAPETPPATPAATPTPTQAGAPITGKTEVIQMTGSADGTKFSFSPDAITIAAGDGLRFDVVSGAPHNVAFDAASVPAAAKAVLVANMSNQDLGELASKLMTTVGESLTISFANVPPGTYAITCTPHLAMGMKLTVTVK